MKTKATATEIVKLKNILIAGIPAVRKSGDRAMMRNMVLRIRQLAGILEVRCQRMQ
jgi:hypothetical protein